MIYVSDDGREFDNWDDCNVYEKSLLIQSLIEKELGAYNLRSDEVAKWICDNRDEITKMFL